MKKKNEYTVSNITLQSNYSKCPVCKVIAKSNETFQEYGDNTIAVKFHCYTCNKDFDVTFQQIDVNFVP
jgi:hypothetical protein